MSRHLPSIAVTTLVSSLLAVGSVFAGDVTGTVANGTLTLTAGAGAEAISIDQIGVANAKEFRVSPGAGTTVNGQGTPQTFSNVTKDIVVALGDGTNTLTVNGIKAPRDLAVNAGAGGDMDTSIAGSSIGDDLILATSGAVIDCDTSVTNIKGDVKFTGGGAADRLQLLIPTRVGGSVIFIGNAGNDQCTVRGTTVKGKIDIEGGANDDQNSIQTSACGGSLTLDDQSGNNGIQVVLCDVAGAVKATFGSGIDNFFSDQTLFGGSLSVELGAGDNNFNFGLSHVLGNLKVMCGPGNDMVQAGDTCFVAGNIGVALGDGTNLARFEDAVVIGGLKINGGSGDDIITLEEGKIEKDARVNGTPATAATHDSFASNSMTILGSLRFSSRSNADQVVIRTKVRKNIDTKFFGAMDSITLDRAVVRQLRVSGQGGVDDVIVSNESNVTDDTELELGDGNNIVMLNNSVFGDDVKVRTGAGDDTLDFVGSVFGGAQDIDTGSGSDTGP